MQVACAEADCTNSVVGQCSGFPSACGRFYCAQHTVDGLCLQCHRAKQRQLSDEQMLERYDVLAQGAPRVTCRTYAVGCVILMGLAVLLFSTFAALMGGGSADPGDVFSITAFYMVCPIALFVPVFALYNVLVRSRQTQYMQRISQDNPGFDAFFKEWIRQKDGDTRRRAGGVLLGSLWLGGVFVKSAKDSVDKMDRESEDRKERSQRERAADDLHAIRKAMEGRRRR